MRTPKNPTHSDTETDPALVAAMTAAKEAPDEATTWDRVETLAAELDQPEQAVRLYGEVLGEELPKELIAELGERAAKFHDEWFSSDSPHLSSVLKRVFEADGSSDWAFQRLTHSLTVAEQWGELLALYDRALQRVKSKSRRGSLLEEAADVAKDFAGDSDRAIGYLIELRKLKPRNKQIASTLERLLDRHERWNALIELWTDRLAVVTAKQAAEVREQIAACWLEKLGDPARALEAIEELLDSGADDTEACRLLEAIVRGASTPADTRDRALDVLRKRYEQANRERDIVAVIEAAIEFADEARARQLREQAGHILATLGESTGSFDHFAAVLEQDPGDTTAQEELRHLAHQSNAIGRYTRVLEGAAARAADAGRAIALLVEAAELHRDRLGDADAAVEAYRRAFATEGAPPQAMAGVCRSLDAMLAAGGRDAERLDVLDRLAGVEERAVERRETLGELAELAERLGELDRAVTTWKRRLEADEADVDAISALVRVHEGREHWSPLRDALRLRADAPVSSHQRRADLERIAELCSERLEDPDRAIETWNELHASYGVSPSSIDALAGLYASVGRWSDYVALLDGAAAQDAARDADLLARAGDACAEQLSDAGRAVEAYRRALAMNPQHEPSRAGLTALLDDADARKRVLETLADLYARTGEWERELDLVDARLAEAPDDAERVAILRRSMTAVERRVGDAERALGYAARALGLAPADVQLADDVARLGREAQAWSTARDAFAAAAAATEDAAVIADLRAREGEICEARLDDLAGALAAYRAASGARPDDAHLLSTVARLGFACGEWQIAADAAVAAMVRTGKIGDGVIDMFGGAADADLRAVVDALAAAVRSADGLAASCSLQLEKALAGWLRDRLDDGDGAVDALRRALGHEPGDADVLVQLAELQRREPGVALFDTLQRLAAVVDNDLDPLVEAAGIAADVLNDGDLVRTTWEAILDRARSLWRRNYPVAGTHAAEPTAQLALDRLAAHYEQAGDAAKSLVLVLDAITWPVDADRRNELRARAAGLCTGLGDRKRAISLYRDLLADRPGDTAALGALAELYAAEDDVNGVLSVRRTELAATEDAGRRLEVRLEIARLAGEAEKRQRRVETLLDNLEEEPGHSDTLDALSAVLRDRARFGDLADVLGKQARAVHERGGDARAAELWLWAARVRENDLSDVDGSIDAYARSVALEERSVAALDGLARLNAGRGAHGEAIDWLQRLLECAPEEQRIDVRLRLARSLVEAGRVEQAVDRLEEAGETCAANPEMRGLLADLYRQTDAWEPLARLLTDSLPHIHDHDESLTTARAAAELFRERLDAPERATAALRRAVDLSPDDLELRKQLAEGLRLAGQYQQARETLEAMIRAFGRRRSHERADAHYELAMVARAQGDIDEALDQLDKATGMAVGNTEMLRSLAELARDSERQERAERAYRALLLAVRRREEDVGESAIGESEVLFELHYLAAAAGDEERVDELRESAVESAVDNDVEVRRARRTLLAHGDFAALVEVLEQRLEEAQDEAARAQVMAYLAEAQAQLGNHEDALASVLDALRCAPDREDLHEAARAIARQADDVDGYVDVVREISTKSRRKADAARQAVLQLELGKTLEKERGDLDGAAEAYKRAADTGERVADALSALARVSGDRGDTAGQTEALDRLLKMAGESSPAERANALYQLAEIRATTKKGHGEALERLEAALAADPRHARAAAILRTALDAVPGSDKALALYERVARRGNDKETLLDFFERSAAADDVEVDSIREGVELATALEARDRAQKLLERAIDRARMSAGGLGDHVWAPTALLELRISVGDFEAASRLLVDLISSIGVDTLWDEALRVAEQARAGGNGAVARSVYASLRDYRPDAREVWEPLFRIAEQEGDDAALEDLARATVPALMNVSERNELRMMYAAYLEKSADGKRAAFETYKDVLLDEPGHLAASGRLEGLLEEIGTTDEIISFVTQQFEDARERGDAEAAAVLALRLRERLRDVDPYEAANVLNAALELAPNNVDLLRAMVEQLGDDADRAEIVRWKQRWLAVAEGQEAETLALELHDLCSEEGDANAAREALERGYRAAPWSAGIREQLERTYRDNGLMRELAGYLRSEAQRVAEPDASVGMLTEVAMIHRDMLFDMDGATDALRLAAELAPQNMTVLSELVRTLQGQGDNQGAITEMERAVERGIESESDRVDLLMMLADARMNFGDVAAAVDDLERAHDSDPERVETALGHALTMLRNEARQRDDLETERKATLRIAERARATGHDEQCREVLEEWLARDPFDTEALYALRDLHAGMQRWDDVIMVCARLVHLEEGDAQLDAARQLALACGQAADPGPARSALEVARAQHPDDAEIAGALRSLYEKTGAYRELAQFVVADANAADDEDERLALLLRATDLLLQTDTPTEALPVLEQAKDLRPDDPAVTLRWVDTLISTGEHDQARATLEGLTSGKGARGKTAAPILVRLARLERAAGDADAGLKTLEKAFNANRNDGEIAAELARAAVDRRQFPLAIKALRTISLKKLEGPISPEQALIEEGRIELMRANRAKAAMLAKKVLRDNPASAAARELLEQSDK